MFTDLLVYGTAILLIVVVVEILPRLNRSRRKRYIEKGIKKLEEFVNKGREI
jgi:hypothetical protein